MEAFILIGYFILAILIGIVDLINELIDYFWKGK